MTYDGQRAMFEAYGRNKYNSTGVIQWMLDNAWPSLIWHLYDYYLVPAGGYFGTKKACERLHARIAEKAAASGDARPLDLDLREQVDTLVMLDDEFREQCRFGHYPESAGRYEGGIFHAACNNAAVRGIDRQFDGASRSR